MDNGCLSNGDNVPPNVLLRLLPERHWKLIEGETRLPVDLVDELKEISGASFRELCHMLHIPQGSFYQLKRTNALLSPIISLRLVRIAAIFRRCFSIFGDRVRAVEWLKTSHWELDDLTPWSMLMTENGLDELDALLDRLYPLPR